MIKKVITIMIQWHDDTMIMITIMTIHERFMDHSWDLVADTDS